MGSKTLIVVVRGWTTTGDVLLLGKNGGEIRPAFLETLAAELREAEVWAPEVDLSMFCMRSAEALSQELFGMIDGKVRSMPGVCSIVLVGYSAGSLLVRRVFCMAHGARVDGTVGEPAASWADRIDRIVMLSGITRGWEQSSAAPPLVRFIAPILSFTAVAVGWVKRMARTAGSHEPFIHQLRRGAPFVVSTRIQYVNVFEKLRARCRATARSVPLRAKGLPSTVFLLGAKDELVSPADCTELGPRIEFAFIELPRSNHTDAVLIDGADDAAVGRRKRLVAAITHDFDALKNGQWAISASDIDDYLDPMDLMSSGAADDEASDDDGDDNAAVKQAVIIMHGIRDNGFWTKRVAREIKVLARTKKIAVRAPTPSYGYFSMLDFVSLRGRDQATYWFMERYADIKSHSPAARISFVGHSNGTYVAARALELCEAIAFEHVVFAGSVVRRDFPWPDYAGRVKAVLNYVGRGDAVVAFLPAVFELLRLPWLDVGGAGAFGFKEARRLPACGCAAPKPASAFRLDEVRFVPGGHGAAIDEPYWPEIARFALEGSSPERKPIGRDSRTRLFFGCAPLATAIGGLAFGVMLLLPVIAVVAYAIEARLPLIHILLAFLLSVFVSWLASRFLRQW